MQYRTCPDCGASLDPGERCDCGGGGEASALPIGTAVSYRSNPSMVLHVASAPFDFNGLRYVVCKQGNGRGAGIFALSALVPVKGWERETR